MLSEVHGLLHDLELSVEKYFSGLNCPELNAFVDEMIGSQGIWELVWTLMEKANMPKMQFFGAVLLRNTIVSYDCEQLRGEHSVFRDKIIEIISTVPRDTFLSSPIVKKLFEALAQLIFRTSGVWPEAIRESLLLITQGGESDTSRCSHLEGIFSTLVINERRSRDVVTFITILAEEFKTVDLSFHERQLTKEFISLNQSFIFGILQLLLSGQTTESVKKDTIHCCSVWMSTFASSTTCVMENTELMDLIYQAMHRSESFLSAGLSCLITIFEDGGSELCSGRETSHLLDDHVLQITLFRPVLEYLVQCHAQNITAGITWEECDQREIISKFAFLLAALAEKQLEHLVRRALASGNELNEAIPVIFQMFLIPFTLSGAYPRDESVSDLALQIWFSILECEVDDSSSMDGINSDMGTSVLRDCHTSFLRQSLLKCRYPHNLKDFLQCWPADEREQWFKLRGELADTLLAAYSHPLSKPWFIEHSDMKYLVEAFTGSCGSAWQDLESFLYVFTAISEQLIHEFHHASTVAHNLVSKLVHHLFQVTQVVLQQVTSSCAGTSKVDDLWPSRSLLATKVLQMLDAYSPVLICLRSGSDALDLAPATQLISACLIDSARPTAYGELRVMLSMTALRTLRTFIQNLFLTGDETTEILNLLDHFASTPKSLAKDVELLASQVTGMLVSLVPEELVTAELIRRLTGNFEHSLMFSRNRYTHDQYNNVCAGRNMSRIDPHQVDQFLHANSAVVEFLRGLSLALHVEVHQPQPTNEIHPRSMRKPEALQLSHDIVIQLHTHLIRLLIRADLSTWDSSCSIFLNEVSRLLQNVFQATDAPFHESAPYGLLELQLNLLNRLIQLETKNSGPLLDLVWVLIDHLAPVILNKSEGPVPRRDDLLKLVAQSLRRIADFLMNTARLGLYTCESEMVGSASTIPLSHPIPAIWLLVSAQQISEQIESFARFLYRMLVWRNNDEASDTSTGLLNIAENSCTVGSLTGLRVCLTVAFTGMCLPEWSTAEPCLKLAIAVLQRVVNASAPDKASLITPAFLFETHCHLVLIVTKGALPRRLITKFADLYDVLSRFVPDKQFALLGFLLDCSQTSVTDWEWLSSTPHLQALLSEVRTAVEKASLSERHRFISTVTRGCIRHKILTDSITAFSNSCKRICVNS
ncbi:hypothetical protein FGIG_00033 [Fasciola gigantica]|uniref:Exportin-1/Importin-beta-like domain-containing protein n=1 Tax=Fasciola gigantica TaxID=46835 RepID=A0A504XQ38_FASGI|nr:hypothetical protein FGIG_00033 [Fasciola gigantica]